MSTTAFVNNLPHDAVGGATLDIVRDTLGEQLIVVTQGDGQGVKTVMNDVMYADFTLLSALEELEAGLTSKFTKDGVTLATTHRGQNLFIDLKTLADGKIEEVVIETFQGLTPANTPYTVPTDVGTDYQAAAAEDPPDTIYYYQNEDGSWGYGYDWNKNAAVTLFHPDGSAFRVITDLLRVTVSPKKTTPGGPVEFEILSSNPEPGTFTLAYNKLMPLLMPVTSKAATGSSNGTAKKASEKAAT